MKFHKYHAIGNDYIVLDPAEAGEALGEQQIRLICHRNYGVGGDGILLGPLAKEGRPRALRIFNPDGSEAETSGNGLRIFARYLYDIGKVGEQPFDVHTQGGVVRCHARAGGRSVTVEMGKVSFRSEEIPVAGEPREVVDEQIAVLDKTFRYCAAGIGNPHCVILDAEVTRETACKYGPAIETAPRFPNRTNVQFMEALDRSSIRIEIWERGAGYTLASGSSSCAAAAVARRLGLCDDDVTVRMPGGQLHVTIGDRYAVTVSGPVTKVCEGEMSEEAFTARTRRQRQGQEDKGLRHG